MKTQRNDPCPCGSNLKYKRCCLERQQTVTVIPEGVEPSQLVLLRREAFDRRDFGFIYDSYHQDSLFRQQFPSRHEYLRHAASSLSKDYRILDCRVLRQRAGADEDREVMFFLRYSFQGAEEESFELARFFRDGDQWRYHSSWKMRRDEFAGAGEDPDWTDFEKVKDRVCF